MRTLTGILMASAVMTALVGVATPSRAAVCGNGVVEGTEECDNTSFCCNPDCTKKATGLDCDDNPYDCSPKRCDTHGTCDAKIHELDGQACVAPGGGDPCHQGTCQTASCVGVSNDPCDGSPSTTCKNCTVHTEASPNPVLQFACDGGNQTNGIPCVGDALACTQDVCVDGTCPVGPQKTCTPTGNECTQNTCTEPNGTCVVSNIATGTPCTNDYNICTKDICRGGQCRHEDPDGDLNGTPCNDNNPCTKTDQCSAGVCVGPVNVGNGVTCWNGNPCVNPGTCNGSGGCVPGSYKAAGTVCDARNDCMSGTRTCNATGVCNQGGTPKAAGTVCDDFNPCTTGGTCNASGVCTGITPTNTGGTCYNRSPNYSDDFCAPGTCNNVGGCVHGPTQTSGTCQDFNSCTDPNTTLCSETGLCTPVCFTDPANHTCVPCNTTCSGNANANNSGVPVPCSCISYY